MRKMLVFDSQTVMAFVQAPDKVQELYPLTDKTITIWDANTFDLTYSTNNPKDSVILE